jgi:F1F0 ATPase subunit 2
MSWIVAASAGAGLGLAYFAGLWFTIRILVRESRSALWVPLSYLCRFVLLGLGLATLSRRGAGGIFAALGGLWLARWHEVAVLFAIREGYLDHVAVQHVVGFLRALRRRLDELDGDVLDTIERDDELSAESTTRLRQAIESISRTPGETEAT